MRVAVSTATSEVEHSSRGTLTMRRWGFRGARCARQWASMHAGNQKTVSTSIHCAVFEVMTVTVTVTVTVRVAVMTGALRMMDFVFIFVVSHTTDDRSEPADLHYAAGHN